MILSKKHKFIFVKGKKVAGTSIEVFLSQICGPKDIITPITPIDEKRRLLKNNVHTQNFGCDSEKLGKYILSLKNNNETHLGNIRIPQGIYYNHMPLSEILELNKEISMNWTIFAIERCPYSKILSWVNMKINFENYKNTGKKMQSDIKSIKNKLEMVIDDQSILKVRNIELYKNKQGVLSAEIMRFENIKEDIMRCMNKLGIVNPPKLEHYKKGMSSNSLNPLNYFSKSQLHQINELFEDEFLSFGYTMLE